jgi:hypothetical protein
MVLLESMEHLVQPVFKVPPDLLALRVFAVLQVLQVLLVPMVQLV